MPHRYSAIANLVYFKIIKGILLIPVALFLSKLDIILRLCFLVQGDIRNESTQGLVK